MKKKVLALFMTLAIAVCFVPTFSFANEGEAPAEPQEAPAVQEPAAPEAAPEVQEPAAPEAAPVEENASVEETKEAVGAAETLEAAETVETQNTPIESTAKWEGYKYVTNNKGTGIQFAYMIGNSEEEKMIDVIDGIADFTQIVAEQLKTGNVCMLEVCNDTPTNKDYSHAHSEATFINIPVQVKIGDKAKKNVTFTYGIDSYILLEEEDEYPHYYTYSFSEQLPVREDIQLNVELVENAIIVGKGKSEGFGNLVLRSDENILSYNTTDNRRFDGGVVKELGNDGGYETDTSLWAGIEIDDNPGVGTASSKIHAGYAKFTTRDEIKAFIAEMNAAERMGKDAYHKLVNAKFNSNILVFEHGKGPKEKKSSNKDDAVGTGDSMNLALFGGMALMALVGAAAVFATRREQ